MANKLFGTDGVRGVANQYPMTADFATKLGMACGLEVCKNHKKVAIARDTRISGEMLQSALTAGFLAAGVDVKLLGVLPTPAVTSIVEDLEVDMAVMITASHNPYFDNGIKLIASNGDKFADEVTAKLEDMVLKADFALSSEKLGKIIEYKEGLEIYLQKAKKFIQGERPLNGMRVVLDCANGSFAQIMPQVFMDLGAGVISLGNEPNGYNINENCGSQHPENLFETVKNAKAQLGIAVDGDGDRLLICDDLGRKVPAEQLMTFMVKYLLKTGKYSGNAVVSTVLSNTAMERYIKEMGLEYYSTKVGERAIVAKMQEVGCGIGGEESGHIVWSDCCKSGDGLVNALLFCLALADEKRKMSEIFPLFEFDPCVFVSLPVETREKVKEIANSEAVKKVVAEATEKMKGVGRVVLHPSGTEPKIRVWVAGSDENLVHEAANMIIDEIKKG
ncbi:MAG: phosphoglucosamine mutase [Alphaproteobacteria bacterium]|nr:phosphoglucosamine mutase [Alphaproteobacteria bacterium]